MTYRELMVVTVVAGVTVAGVTTYSGMGPTVLPLVIAGISSFGLWVTSPEKIRPKTNTQRRDFSPNQKNEIWSKSGGYCVHCDVELTPFKGESNSFQADHIVPHSKGGETTVENGQALCQACNGSKGNRFVG